jgi:type III pantothenate kinase
MARHAFQDARLLSSDFGAPRAGICRGVDSDGALLFEAMAASSASSPAKFRCARPEPEMLLCLDAGNTRLKFGLFDGGRWRCRARSTTRPSMNCPANCRPADAHRRLQRRRRGGAAAHRGAGRQARASPDWLCSSSAAACGVSNLRHARPTRRRPLGGADRRARPAWRRLRGGRSPAPRPRSTRSTPSGRFRGGLILPGLALMRAALAGNTADLPHASGSFRSLPTNTDDAIVSGALHATLGAIERMRATLGADVACLLSGGAAAELAPHLEPPQRPIDNLVLEGLARFAENG